MFPDSQIASNFQCGERKSAYVADFGLAPYILGKLKEQIIELLRSLCMLFFLTRA